jgi:hypothetical protein
MTFPLLQANAHWTMNLETTATDMLFQARAHRILNSTLYVVGYELFVVSRWDDPAAGINRLNNR